MSSTIESSAARYLAELCWRHPDRHVGGPGNLAATRLFADAARERGLDVDVTAFDCVDWVRGAARIESAGVALDLEPGPYSLPFEGTAPLLAVSTIEGLEAANATGAIILLHGAIAREQLMPKGFVFYNPESHRRVIAALEAKAPAAVLAATGRNPDLAGSLYPFPLIEDADFDIPNAYLKDVDGARLLERAGKRAALRIDSGRVAARGEHVVARRQGTTGAGRVVVFGHIDSKWGSPGALDNATGAAVLLVLAGLLEDYKGPMTVELVPLNGEDDYAAHGQMMFLRENEGRWGDVVLGLNSDACAHVGARTAVSLYGCPEPVADAVRGAMARRSGFIEGTPWPQSDHSLFVHNGVPAVAVTSEDFAALCSQVTHTAADDVELADAAIVVEVARFFLDLIASTEPRA